LTAESTGGGAAAGDVAAGVDTATVATETGDDDESTL